MSDQKNDEIEISIELNEDKDKSKDKSKSKDNLPKSTHNMTGSYAVLQETNDKECESWLYFIKKEGNEEALKHLQKQLEKVDWFIMDDLSTFDLDLEYYVSAQTAKEMTKVDLNAYSFHRKFDGKLEKINMEFKKKDNDETRICKVFDQIGYGQIDNFISDEDIDTEDLPENDTDDSDETFSSSESDSESVRKSNKKLPAAFKKHDIPKWAQIKQKHRK